MESGKRGNMGRRTTIGMLALACALLPLTGMAEEINFSASVDRSTISRLERLNYTLTIEGARDGKPELPEISGFEVIGSSTSTQFSLVNNQTQVRQATTYTLIPLGAGEFTIPPARLVYAGKTYLSRPVKVRVTDNQLPESTGPRTEPAPPTAGAAPADPAAAEAAPLFITTEVDRQEAYVNEQVTLSFKLFRRLRISNLKYTPPPTTGFVEESLGEEKNYGQVREGVRYEISELSRAVFPINAGELTIGPAELKGEILVPRQRRRTKSFGFDDSFFEDFFGGGFAERQPFRLRSKPITLKVKPLPREGRPKAFRGAVGKFDLEVAAAPAQVRVGEPVTVTMKVRGIGNLDTVSVPVIPTGDRFQTYAPEIETRKALAGNRLGGEKIFKQVFIPRAEEVAEIPAATLSYFDPGQGTYRTLTSPPIPITVEASAGRETLRLVEEARGRGEPAEEVRLLERDILYIKNNPGRVRNRGTAYYLDPVFWIAVILFPGIVLAVRAVTARQDRLREDVVYARQVGASRSARKRFREARRLLAAGEREKFYGEVHRAFSRYLGDKFRIPAGAVDGKVIRAKLAAAGADEKVGNEVEDCLAHFDRARFSGSEAGESEMREFLDRADNLVGKLERIKVR